MHAVVQNNFQEKQYPDIGYRFTWQVQLSSPYTPKVLQTYLMGPGHYSTVTIMVIR
jgi:hypothetical protein